ncbi:hypothetical protein ACQEUX_19240 [Micromonospora sp. CA-259024]|uniref:hypothetical protein n=1 Tax=Micromonospora sp. CA-259024 TaxID=3239965 RepID=UPI003D92F85B
MMTATIPHQSLRYLIRATGTPEVTTNDLLEALLITDRAMHHAFLDAVSMLTGTDLAGTRLGRETYTVDELTGKQSYRDFTLTRGEATPCIIETKVDSALTSADQAARYLRQLPDGGALVLVTRAPLTRSLALQAGQQLGVALQERSGVHRGEVDGRKVIVLSWTHLLRAVADPAGKPFDELLALDAALEGISDFTPFTAAVNDIAVARMVSQIVDIAEEVCASLSGRLAEADVLVDSVSTVRKNGRALWVTVAVLQHEFWVGYDADYWSVVPGDPDDDDSGKPTADPPSPFWIGRFNGHVRRAMAAIVTERRARLDRLGVTRPLRVAVGAPIDAVVELLLEQAVAHIGALSAALHADPDAVQTHQLPTAGEYTETGHENEAGLNDADNRDIVSRRPPTM